MRLVTVFQVLLLTLFIGVGLLGTYGVARDWLRGLDTWSWEASTCTIESSEVLHRSESGGFAFQVSYSYEFRGERHSGNQYRHDYFSSDRRSDAQVLSARFQVGDRVACWVDPEEPDRSYLVRSNLWAGLWIFGPLLFVAIGGGSLWFLLGSHTRAREEAGIGFAEELEPPEQVLQTGQPGQPLRPEQAKEGLSGVMVGALLLLPGAFFLFGAGFLIPFFLRPAFQVVEARSWSEVPCQILSSDVRSHPGEDGATYGIDVLFEYEINGRQYRSNRYQFLGGTSSGYERKARIVEELRTADAHTCLVDPDDLHEAVIERRLTGDYLFGLIPLAFTLIGLAGLVIAVKVLRDAKRDAARPAWMAPTAPGDTPVLPGLAGGRQETTGPLTLEPASSPLGKLGCAVIVALFWNGLVSIFVWQVFENWQAGTKEWWGILILTPFALIGLLLLVGIPYSILALLNPRPRVQLTPGTLTVGESAQLNWSFTGMASRVRRVRIWLEAIETRTTYGDSSVRVSTNRLETPEVEILDRGRELPLATGAVTFTVPPNTPASSEGDVAVTWKLKLQGDIVYWPDINEEYEVGLLPSA